MLYWTNAMEHLTLLDINDTKNTICQPLGKVSTQAQDSQPGLVHVNY